MIPRLRLTVIERAVYSHLLRHSRLEGKRQLRFSILWLAQSVCLTTFSVRKNVRRLVAKGALRLAERSKRGHVLEVRLPEEIPAVRAGKIAGGCEARPGGADNLEETDFLETQALREAIHAREGGHCFYCLRKLTPMVRCIDHVIPVVLMGSNSYRNLVSCCAECNSQKGEQKAEDFLRWLYREGRLTASDLTGRLGELCRLASGKLRPALISGGIGETAGQRQEQGQRRDAGTLFSKRRGAVRKENHRGAPLRGRGTPAYPARLRSERTRNPKDLFVYGAARGDAASCGEAGAAKLLKKSSYFTSTK